MEVFETDNDRLAYFRFLKKYAAQYHLSIYAYWPMTNPIHLVAEPANETALGKALRDAHTVYAMYFNARTALSGRAGQRRFYSCLFDEHHLWAAVRYVKRNPVKAGLVELAEQYRWLSAAVHCGRSANDLLSVDFPPPVVIENWSAWLAQPDEESVIAYICQQTQTRGPCGSETFLGQREGLLCRNVR